MALNLKRADPGDDDNDDDLPKHGDFMPTMPGPMFAHGDAELAFGPTGLESVRAWVVDMTSMRCDTVWHITEAGSWSEDCVGGEFDVGCSTAMATIVHLTQASGEDTVARQIDLLRWVYAWRVDDDHVAVAEATYNVPHPERTGADIALMRMVCEDCVSSHERPARSNGSVASSEPAAPAVPAASDRSDGSEGSAASAAPPPPRGPSLVSAPGLASTIAQSLPGFAAMTFPSPLKAAVPSSPASSLPSVPGTGVLESAFSSLSPGRRGQRPAFVQPLYRAAAAALIAVYVVVALVLFFSYRHASALYGEALQLQSRAELAMLHQVTERLSQGDYGEVQSELELFATRRHFEAALVTNARGRAVAIVGDVRDVRIGDAPGEQLAATARVADLVAPGTPRQGQMYTWGTAVLTPSSVGAYTAAGVLSCTLITGLTLWWLRRRAERGD